MAPKTAPDASADGLTPAENKFIKTMFDNMTTRPDADWNKVASDLGLKDAKCAKERFRQISNRHGWGSSAGSGTSPAKKGTAGGKVTKAPAGPRKPRAAKKKKESTDDDDDEMDVKPVKDEESGDGLDDEF